MYTQKGCRTNYVRQPLFAFLRSPKGDHYGNDGVYRGNAVITAPRPNVMVPHQNVVTPLGEPSTFDVTIMVSVYNYLHIYFAAMDG